MKINDLLTQKRTTFSLEVFPPKADAPLEPVRAAAAELSKLRPDFISVTYGALGQNADRTVELASYIQRDLGTAALAHMTCIASERHQVDSLAARLLGMGVHNVLALRGDRPEDGTPLPAHDFTYAHELIGALKQKGDFCVGGACYPEGHIECGNRLQDIDHLKIKADAGCDFFITQMFFDNHLFYNFLNLLTQKGIHTPVIAGIMPVTQARQIRRIIRLSGATLTPKFKAMLDRFEHDPAAMFQTGIAYAVDQVVDLIVNGVRGVHIYTMNKPAVGEAIAQNLSALLKA